MNDLQYFIKQNPIVKKCALVLLILIGLWTFGSFQIVVLKSSSSFVVSATRNPRDVVYSKKYTATHIKVLKRGTWYIQAKNLSNGQSATVLKSLSPIKFITQVLKDQLKAEKIASIGDRCVLYDNPSTEQTIVSSCQSQGATITSLESGTNPTKILSYMTITSAASAPDGFVAVTQNNHGQSFSVVVYNAATNDSTTLLTTKPGALTPVLVTDQNGNASYFIADKAIYKINTTGSEKIGDVPSTINKNILLAANTTQNLYIITGLSPEANEGDSDVPYTPSTLSSIKLGSRKIEVSSQTKLPSGFIFTSITTSADRLSVAGDGYGKPGSVICETKSTDLDCFKPWSLNDYVGSIVHYKNRIFYVSEGVLWEYDTLRKSSQALFASSTIKIVAANMVNGRIALAANQKGVETESGYINLLLDPENKSPVVRIEERVPVYILNDSYYADTYRHRLLFYSVGDDTQNTSMSTLQKSLPFNTQDYVLGKKDLVTTRSLDSH